MAVSSSSAALRVEADLDRLADVRRFVREQAGALGASTEAVADLVQAVDEAVTNVIVHGYDGETGRIDLTIRPDGDTIQATIADRAPLFDPTGVATPATDLPPAERPAVGGMGVHLVRECMDDVVYRPRPGGGNELTMIRSRGPKARRDVTPERPSQETGGPDGHDR